MYTTGEPVPADGLVLYPKGTYHMRKDIKGYLPLEKGLYRIRKDISRGFWSDTGESLKFYSYYVIAKFEWEL